MNNIRPIEAIHAIRPKRSFLCLYYLKILRLVKHLPVVHPTSDCGHEISIILELIFANVYKLRQVIPFHFLALTMEVKPNVTEILVLELIVELGKLVTYTLLSALFVNEVDQVLITVHL